MHIHRGNESAIHADGKHAMVWQSLSRMYLRRSNPFIIQPGATRSPKAIHIKFDIAQRHMSQQS